MTLARLVLLFLNASVVLGFVGGMAARYVHPRHAWWLQVIALGLPAFGVALLVAAAGWGVAGRWVLAALHVALALTLLSRFVALPDRASSGPALDVLTFNAKPGKLVPSGAEAMQTLLDDHGPDVLALQSAGVGFDDDRGAVGFYQELGPLFSAAGGYSVPRPAPPEVLDTRLPVFTNLSWDASAQPVGMAAGDDDDPAARMVTMQWNDQEIVVINVRLESFGERRPWREQEWSERLSPAEWLRTIRDSKSAFLRRAEDAELVRSMIDAAGDRPVIVAGDLNSTLHQWTYRHVARDLRDAAVVGGRPFAGTYHVRLPIFRIDYILVSRHWTVEDMQVIKRPHSDHLPVTASITLTTDNFADIDDDVSAD